MPSGRPPSTQPIRIDMNVRSTSAPKNAHLDWRYHSQRTRAARDTIMTPAEAADLVEGLGFVMSGYGVEATFCIRKMKADCTGGFMPREPWLRHMRGNLDQDIHGVEKFGCPGDHLARGGEVLRGGIKSGLGLTYPVRLGLHRRGVIGKLEVLEHAHLAVYPCLGIVGRRVDSRVGGCRREGLQLDQGIPQLAKRHFLDRCVRHEWLSRHPRQRRGVRGKGEGSLGGIARRPAAGERLD